MISRSTIAIDRLAALVVALVLVIVGAAAIAWWFDLGASPESLDVSGLSSSTDTAWWPWATAVVGALLVVIGLRWLVAHLPRRGVSHLSLPGSGPTGRLRVGARPVGSAAAASLRATPGVTSCNGRVLRERGQLVASLRADVAADADLRAVAGAADRVAADLAGVLGRDDVRCEVMLRVARGNNASRVS